MPVKERPILFTAPMVRAILEGRKTVTRRLVKPQPKISDNMFISRAGGWAEGLWSVYKMVKNIAGDFCPQWQSNMRLADSSPDKHLYRKSPSPYGKPGDQLWVREIFRFDGAYDNRPPSIVPEGVAVECEESPSAIYTKGNGHRSLSIDPGKWRPSIFMPRWASRINLKITNITVERLQCITEEDAKAEGVKLDCPVGYIPAYQASPYVYCFAQLWDSINGKKAPLESNPWVWRVEFKIMKKVYSDLAIPPGEYLAEVIGIDGDLHFADNQKKVDQFALKCGLSAEFLYRLISGYDVFTLSISQRISKHTDVPTHIWTGLEEKYRETLKRNKEARNG